MIEALKLSLEAITKYLSECPDPSEEAVEGLCDAASAARKAIAKAGKQGEPVAKVVLTETLGLPCLQWLDLNRQFDFKGGEYLYTTPQQRTWVGLSNEQFAEACKIAENGNYLVAFQRIQHWIKEKNT